MLCVLSIFDEFIGLNYSKMYSVISVGSNMLKKAIDWVDILQKRAGSLQVQLEMV